MGKRKEIDLTGTKADKVIRTIVKEAKTTWREGPKCTCGSRTSRCRCDGA